MSVNCLVIGESGTGKSTSLRNLPLDNTAIIQVVAKPLPFRASFKTKVAGSIDLVISMIQGAVGAGRKIIVIDDVQYLLVGEFMSRAKEKGYDKFTDLGLNVWKLLQASLALPADVRIYLLWHTEFHPDGRIKAKTVGKMLDEKVTIEGMFSIVLRTCVQDGAYSFITQNQGNDTTKSPYGMFGSALIPNDLAKVDAAICDYYGINKPQEQELSPVGVDIAGVVVDGSSKATVDPVHAETLAQAEARF